MAHNVKALFRAWTPFINNSSTEISTIDDNALAFPVQLFEDIFQRKSLRKTVHPRYLQFFIIPDIFQKIAVSWINEGIVHCLKHGPYFDKVKNPVAIMNQNLVDLTSILGAFFY